MEDCVTRSQETAPVDWAGQETAVIEVSWLCSSYENKTADFNLNSKINEMYKFCLNMSCCVDQSVPEADMGPTAGKYVIVKITAPVTEWRASVTVLLGTTDIYVNMVRTNNIYLI